MSGANIESMLRLAEAEIASTYGDIVSVKRKRKSLIKFGRNDSIGLTQRVIMQFQGSEAEIALPTTNAIDKLVCTDATFTGQVVVEGHTISGSDLTFVSPQTIQANGQTAVDLTTPLARATRVYPLSGNLASTSDKLFVYENVATTSGVPNDTSKIHVLFDGVYGQSQKCQTAISKDDYWILTLVYGGILKKQAASADILLQIKKVGTTAWRTVFELPVSTNGSDHFSIDAPPAFIVPKNHDVRMSGVSSATGTELIAGIAGYIAAIV